MMYCTIIGTTSTLADGVAKVDGLSKVAGEMIEFPNNVLGIALNLEEDSVGCVLLEMLAHLRRGMKHAPLANLSVPVGKNSLDV